jgi:hypothetical protein
MSATTDVLIQLIKDMIGVLKTHTQTLQLDELEKDLAEQEEKLNNLQEENMAQLQEEATDEGEMEGGGEEEGFELTIQDLNPEYQEFIANTMGYESVNDLLTEHPDLSNIILTSFKL